MPVSGCTCGAAASNAVVLVSATGADIAPDVAGMNASSTIGALSSYADAAACSTGALASCVETLCATETNPFDTAAETGAATLPAAAATPATVAAAAAACVGSLGCPLPSVAHCAVLASIERSVSCTLGAGVIGAAGFSVHA